jgi:hypothetical protein
VSATDHPTLFGEAVAGCTPFPDRKLCSDLECTYGGTHGTHTCKELGSSLVRWRSPTWQKRVEYGLDPWTMSKPRTVEDLRAAWDRLGRRGAIDPADIDGWHHALAHLRYTHAEAAAAHVRCGRCRSGKRWFWYAASFSWDQAGGHCDDPVCGYGWTGHEHGWTDSEEDAITALSEAVLRFGGRDPRWNRAPDAFARGAGSASEALKRVNSAKRAARPASGAIDAGVVEYLYEPWWVYGDEGDHKGINVYQITKMTTKRVYYDKTDRWDRLDGLLTLGYISREELEADTRCRDKCPRDVPAGLVCAPHGRDFSHCVHFGDWSSQGPRCWPRGGCGQTCPAGTQGWQCTKHRHTWDHCPHGREACPDGYPPGRLGYFFTSRDAAEEYLYSAERERERERPEREAEVKRLRREMAAVHPDRGGSNEEFIAARERYERAAGRAS